MTETNIDKDVVVKLLKDNRCFVVFKKVDGTKREMTCTLREDLLPKVEAKESNGKTKKSNPDVLPVFDLDKQAWRSFRFDSVESLLPLPN